MKSGNRTLEQIRIAEPCNASWDRMKGDERVRFCGECRKNVYNLSAMSRTEAELLVHEMEGRLCVRFYQRRDGTVLTDNCPVGVRKAKIWLSVQLAGIAATFASLLSLGSPTRAARMGDVYDPQRTPFVVLNQEPVPTMGSPAPPPPQTPKPAKAVKTMGRVDGPIHRMGRVRVSQPSKKSSRR